MLMPKEKEKIKFDLENFALDDVLEKVKIRKKHRKALKSLNKKQKPIKN
jgi:hypothetical protein